MRISPETFGLAPMADPLSYPGNIPVFDYVFRGDTIEPLSDSSEVDAYLSSYAVAPLGERHALVACGSNASPAQLQVKFADVNPQSATIPVISGVLDNAAVVYSAHISRYGSIPATVMSEPSAQAVVHVLFVDDAQLEIIDATEAHNYRRVELAGERITCAVSGPGGGHYLYESRHGALLVDGRPQRLDALGQAELHVLCARRLDLAEPLHEASSSRIELFALSAASSWD